MPRALWPLVALLLTLVGGLVWLLARPGPDRVVVLPDAPPAAPAPNRTAPPVQPPPAPTQPQVAVLERPVPEPTASKPPATTPPIAAGPAASPTSAVPIPPEPGPGWLAALNAGRKLAGQAPVRAEPGWLAECAAHAAYMASTDTGSHREDPASPEFTAAGARCAGGHYFVSSDPTATAGRALAYWFSAPFHAPQLLDPRLERVAIGLGRDSAGEVQTAVALEVRRGRNEASEASWPVYFPAEGTVSPHTHAANVEWPDPLAACPGYAAPTGPPILLLLGPGRATQVQSGALKVNGQPAALCLLTEQTYTNPKASDQQAGRGVLASVGAVLALPREPLPPGAQVKVNLKVDGKTFAWGFQIGP